MRSLGENLNAIGICLGLMRPQSLDRERPHVNHRLLRALHKERSIELQRYLQFNLQVSFDPGGFLACFKRKFLATYISKNGTTTLADYVCFQDFPSVAVENPHDFIGYVLDIGNRVSTKVASSAEYRSFVRFAIYRDPVERFLSLFRDKIYKGRKDRMETYGYFANCGIVDAELDEFIDFAERELTKPVLDQDQHIRRQSSYYAEHEVDYIVDLQSLDLFFREKLRTPLSRRLNSAEDPRLDLTPAQATRIKSLYERDYQLLANPLKVYARSHGGGRADSSSGV
jgi:Sulfotransferase family